MGKVPCLARERFIVLHGGKVEGERPTAGWCSESKEPHPLPRSTSGESTGSCCRFRRPGGPFGALTPGVAAHAIGCVAGRPPGGREAFLPADGGSNPLGLPPCEGRRN